MRHLDNTLSINLWLLPYPKPNLLQPAQSAKIWTLALPQTILSLAWNNPISLPHSPLLPTELQVNYNWITSLPTEFPSRTIRFFPPNYKWITIELPPYQPNFPPTQSSSSHRITIELPPNNQPNFPPAQSSSSHRITIELLPYHNPLLHIGLPLNYHWITIKLQWINC